MKTFRLPNEEGQVKAGVHYFIISLYINNVSKADIEGNWVINAYLCIGALFLHFYYGKLLATFCPLLKHSRLTDLKI